MADQAKANALQFYDELIGATETFSAIADTHGVVTLANMIYLQAGILAGFQIEIPKDGPTDRLLKTLPSYELWSKSVFYNTAAFPDGEGS